MSARLAPAPRLGSWDRLRGLADEMVRAPVRVAVGRACIASIPDRICNIRLQCAAEDWCGESVEALSNVSAFVTVLDNTSFASDPISTQRKLCRR